MLSSEGQNLGERRFQNSKQFIDHFGLTPEKALQVLDPLEVRNDDAACIAQDVWNNEDLRPLIENAVGFGGCGAIRCLGENATFYFAGIVLRDLTFERSRN